MSCNPNPRHSGGGARRAVSLTAVLVAGLACAPGARADRVTGGLSASASDHPAAQAPAPRKRLVLDWASLGRSARVLGRRDLRRGMRGADVKVLQQLLTELGYIVPWSGRFDAKTQKQVRRFQADHRLPTVGRMGPSTAAALRGAHAGLRPAASPGNLVRPNADGWSYPIRGRHDYGDALDRYGAAREGHRHAGQDVLSPCGTPLVAARAGRVLGADYGGAAGYYLAVHTTDTPYDYFYAHLQSRAVVREGQTIQTGQLVGYVGQTGDAVGCHLHFELWAGAWWNGGHTVDPLAFLKAWDGPS
jgi:murein DD-endopeptidase MepM/ murein hydrolase activator NlpD